MTGILDPLTLAQENDPLDPGVPATDTDATNQASTADPDLEHVRQLALRAHPDVVPELVAGATIAELLASIGAAEAAYANLAGRIGAASPQVPAGTVSPAPVDPERLPIAEKIRRGLADRKR